MEKAELRQYIKDKFKALGFQSRKSTHYKIIDNDYLIGFEMEPSTYCKGYCFTCGIIYLPDEQRMPFRGIFDLHWDFVFPWEPDGDPDVQRCIERKLLRRIFEYEDYSIEQLDRIFEANYNYFMLPLYDKNYGLDIFRSSWRRMQYYPVPKIEMLCKRAGLDAQEVLAFLGKVNTNG